MIKADNVFRLVITIGLLLSGFVSYRVWPLRERLSLAEQKTQAIPEIRCGLRDAENRLFLAEQKITLVQTIQGDIKKKQEERPTEKELTPVLEGIQKQFEWQKLQNERHEAVCSELAKSVKDLEKAVTKLENKL